MKKEPLVITGLRGRNGADSPLSLPDWQCCDAVNVDFYAGDLANRRGGSANQALTFSSGGPFTGWIVTLLRHVPGVNEQAAELWAVDIGTGLIGRLAAGTLWTAPTLKDAVFTTPYEVTGASLGGNFWLTYASTQNRSYVWDTFTVRRRGFATPGVAGVVTLGGSGNTFTRFYRVRWVHISGTDTVRRSEPGTAVSISITDDSGVAVTRPTAASEGETHWELEYAASADGPWYVRDQTLMATATVNDTDASIDTDLEESDDAGTHTPPPAFRWTVKAGGRLLNAGAHQSVAGSSFVPLPNGVYWSPVEGELDVGDLERQPVTYRVQLDHPVNGLSEALNGIHYAFGYYGISRIVPTLLPGEGAFQRLTDRTDIGCIRHQTIVMADDEHGNACCYFLSHRGPYRIGPKGMQYLGRDIEDLWATVNLDASVLVGHGVYHSDKHQILWWVATGDATYPDVRLRFDTQLGQSDGDEVRNGWSRDTGDAATASCSVMFAATIGATMTRQLTPYFGRSFTLALYKADSGTDDAGTDFQAYIDTKEYTPAGLGQNCSIVDPHVVGTASATALVTVTCRTDFGKRTSESQQISLAPEGSETHVQKKVDGLQTANIGTVRFRIGDGAAIDPGFGTLDAFVALVERQEPR